MTPAQKKKALAILEADNGLLESMLKRATGELGELYVRDMLIARGHKVDQLGNNSQECDLIVDGKFSVEVKSVRSNSAWFARNRPASADFWVLVRLSNDPSDLEHETAEAWILTLEEVQDCWDRNDYNQNLGRKGVADLRRKQVTKYKSNQWEKMSNL